MITTQVRRFAPLGLYLALVAAVASLGIYIVMREFNLALQISLGLFVIGLAVFAILDPARVREVLTGRQARYGSNALVMVLAFLGILVVINYLVFKYPQRWDLTEGKQNTLAPETVNLAQSLPKPVTALAFYSSSYPKDTTKTILDNLKISSKGKFDYKFVDPVANPVEAQSNNVTQDGTIVFTMDNRKESVTTTAEQDIDTALIKLTNPGSRTVYFLVGHGEHDTGGSGNSAYSDAKNALVSKNYTVKTLNLLAENQVPKDALAIIIAGPQKPLSDSEVNLLKTYIDNGGSLFVMEEPTPVTQFGDSPDPLASYLSSSWGITLGNDYVIDGTANPPNVAIAAEYGNHAITDKLQTVVTIFPTARSVQEKTVSNATTTVLVRTSSNSWGETNFTDLKNNQVQFNQGQDLPGPVPIAVAAQSTSGNAKVVVIGDSDYASDGLFNQYGNGSLFSNAVDWTAGQSSLINLTPKNSTTRIIVPPQKYVMNGIFLGSIIVIPGAVVLAGVVVWVQRRRRG